MIETITRYKVTCDSCTTVREQGYSPTCLVVTADDGRRFEIDLCQPCHQSVEIWGERGIVFIHRAVKNRYDVVLGAEKLEDKEGATP